MGNSKENLVQENEIKQVEEQTPDQKHSDQWIKEVAEQSWNPELLITGVAIYASTYLPILLDWLFTYYRINLMPDRSFVALSLPLLIYSAGTAMSYVLIFTFIFHFIARAFWVALVGLLSVYPKGIDFNNLKKLSSYTIQKFKVKFGRLEDYIQRLDHFCSLLLSLSFLLVIFLISLVMVYGIFFLVVNLGRLFFSAEVMQSYESIITNVFFIFLTFISMISLLLNLKPLRDHPMLTKLQYIFGTGSAHFFFLWFYKPMQYILLTLNSNFRNKQYNYFIIILIAMMMVTLQSVVVYKTIEITGKEVLETREYYSTGSDKYRINPDFYENLRQESKIIERFCISSDVITGNQLKLFIAYPKNLDERLKAFYKQPENKVRLSEAEKKARQDEARMKVFDQYYRISVNDTIFKQPEMFYYAHPNAGEKGILVYLPAKQFKEGRNYLKIEWPNQDQKGAMRDVIIPFMYEPRIR